MESAFPVEFGSYVLTERVGAGGMAEIFLATEPTRGLGRRLVIKRILPQLSGDDQFVRMFIEEARLCVNLRHANIVEVYDLGEVDDQYFIAMEYVHGRDLLKTLAACAKQRMPFPTDLALYIVMEVLKGLDYAHNLKGEDGRPLGIIHRDVSPSNVLLSYEGEVKIGDFGIAKASTREKTATGILKGKFGYMAPEQVMGRPIDHRADVFAVGILLYELLTGHRLFAGRSDLVVLERVRDAVIDPPPRHYRPDLAYELEKIVLRALSRDANDRFQSTADLHDALYDYTFRSGVVVGPKMLARFMHDLFLSDETENHDAPGLARLIAAAQAAQGKGRRPTTNGRRKSSRAIPSSSRADSLPTSEESVDDVADFGDESTAGADSDSAEIAEPRVDPRRFGLEASPSARMDDRATDEADDEDILGSRPDSLIDDESESTDHPTGLISAVTGARWEATTGARDPAERAAKPTVGPPKPRTNSETDGGSITPYGGVPVVDADADADESEGFDKGATFENVESDDNQTIDGATIDSGIVIESPGPIERNDGEGESTELLGSSSLEDDSLWELHASDLIELSSTTLPPITDRSAKPTDETPARDANHRLERDAKTANAEPPSEPEPEAPFEGDEVTIGRDEEEVEREVQAELARAQELAARRAAAARKDSAVKATKPLRRGIDEPTESLNTDQSDAAGTTPFVAPPEAKAAANALEAASAPARKVSRLEAVNRAKPADSRGIELPALREVQTYLPEDPNPLPKRLPSFPKAAATPPRVRGPSGAARRAESKVPRAPVEDDTPAELEFAPTNFGELLKAQPEPTVRAPSSGILAAVSEAAAMDAEVKKLRGKAPVRNDQTIGGDLAGFLGKMGDLGALERAPVPPKEPATRTDSPASKTRRDSHLDPPTDSIGFGAEDSETANVDGNGPALTGRQERSEIGRLDEDGASGLFGALSVLDRDSSSLGAPGFDADEGSLAETGEIHDLVLAAGATERSQEQKAPASISSGDAPRPPRPPVVAPSVSSRSQEIEAPSRRQVSDPDLLQREASDGVRLDTTGAEPWGIDPESGRDGFSTESTESLDEEDELIQQALAAQKSLRPGSILEAVGRPRNVSASASGDGHGLDAAALEDLQELRHGERVPGLLSDSFALEPAGAGTGGRLDLPPLGNDESEEDRRAPSRLNSAAERRVRAVVERQRAVKEFNRTKEIALPEERVESESRGPGHSPTATGFQNLPLPPVLDLPTADLGANAPPAVSVQARDRSSIIEGRGVMINRIAAGLAIVAIVLFSFAGATWVRKLRTARGIDAGIAKRLDASGEKRPGLSAPSGPLSANEDAGLEGSSSEDSGSPADSDTLAAVPDSGVQGAAPPLPALPAISPEDAGISSIPDVFVGVADAGPRPDGNVKGEASLKPDAPAKSDPPSKADEKHDVKKSSSTKKGDGKRSGKSGSGNARVVLKCSSPMDARIEGIGSWSNVTQQIVSLDARPRGYQVTLTQKGGKANKKNIRPIAGKTLTVGCE
ncbi:MAG: serine/threonine protein kinase [Deltaproteobacteria bacterium]|nr:serine/threonine protein kinase [Deltaproteobacteria bacterium]